MLFLSEKTDKKPEKLSGFFDLLLTKLLSFVILLLIKERFPGCGKREFAKERSVFYAQSVRLFFACFVPVENGGFLPYSVHGIGVRYVSLRAVFGGGIIL